MVNVLDLLRFREQLGMGHDVMSHYSLIFLADIVKVFPEMHCIWRMSCVFKIHI